MTTDNIETRLLAIRTRISNAAQRAGRDPDEISLLAASKTVDKEIVMDAIAAGGTIGALLLEKRILEFITLA